jgi:hypothetical protein
MESPESTAQGQHRVHRLGYAYCPAARQSLYFHCSAPTTGLPAQEQLARAQQLNHKLQR